MSTADPWEGMRLVGTEVLDRHLPDLHAGLLLWLLTEAVEHVHAGTMPPVPEPDPLDQSSLFRLWFAETLAEVVVRVRPHYATAEAAEGVAEVEDYLSGADEGELYRRSMERFWREVEAVEADDPDDEPNTEEGDL